MPVATKDVVLHPGQVGPWVSESRFVAIIAGTGSGKTFFGPLWLSREIAKHPGEQWMVVSPTSKMMRRTTRVELVKAFRGTNLEGRLKETTGEYLLPDGGIIYLVSADRPEYLEGGQIKGAWLDEAGQMKRGVWIVLQARLGLKQGRCLITTTPYGKNWLYLDFVKQADIGDPDYQYFTFDSTMNPYYSRNEFERMKGKLTEAEFRMRYMGSFENLQGLLYPHYEKVVVDKMSYPPLGSRRVGGIDFGWSAPTAIITGFLDGAGVLRVYREFYEEKKLTRDIADYLDLSATYWADPSAPREIEELTKLGFTVLPATNDFRPGIIKVNEYIADNRLVLPRDACPFLISEMANYTQKEGEEKPERTAVDHAVDACRYMVMGVDMDSGASVYFV